MAFMKAFTNGSGGESGAKVYDETFASFSSNTFSVDFEFSAIIFLGKYNGNDTQMMWGKYVPAKYYLGTYNPINVGDSSSAGFMTVTNTGATCGFTINNSYYSRWTDVRVIVIE